MNLNHNPVLAMRSAIAAGPGQTAALAAEHAAELARLQGYGLTPQAGCGLHETWLGDATVWVEYEYEPAGGDGWNEPRYDASVSVIGMLINGTMIDVDMLDSKVLDRWQQEIIDAAAEAADDARISAAEAYRDQREAA